MYTKKLNELNNQLFNIAKNNIDAKILPYHKLGLFFIPFLIFFGTIYFHYFYQNMGYAKYYFFYVFSALSFFGKILFDSDVKMLQDDKHENLSYIHPKFIDEDTNVFDFIIFIASLIKSVFFLGAIAFISMLFIIPFIDIDSDIQFLFDDNLALSYLVFLFILNLFYLKHNINKTKNIEYKFIQQNKFKQSIDHDIKRILSEFEDKNDIFNTYILLNDARKENFKYLTYELNKKLNLLLLKNNYNNINDYLIKQNKQENKQTNDMINI